jgi:hypothetical protein
MSKLSPTKPVLHASEHLYAGNDKLTGIRVLLNSLETDTAETNTTTNETTKYTFTLPINSYSFIMIEAGFVSRYEKDVASKANFTYNIKYNGATQKTFNSKVLALSTSGCDTGAKVIDYISFIMTGGQAAQHNITITGQTDVNDANCGFVLKFARVWGII